MGNGEGSSLVNCAPIDCYTDVDWVSNFKGKIGYAIGNFLPYITAGVSLSGVTVGTRQPVTPGVELYENDILGGYNFGGGVETKIDNRFSVKAEYLRSDFGNTTYYIPSQGSVGRVPLEDVNTIKLSLIYNF